MISDSTKLTSICRKDPVILLDWKSQKTFFIIINKFQRKVLGKILVSSKDSSCYSVHFVSNRSRSGVHHLPRGGDHSTAVPAVGCALHAHADQCRGRNTGQW